MTNYRLRVELPGGGFYDAGRAAEDLASARSAFEGDNPELAPFEWRGAVCFAKGLRPAEERRA